MTDNEQNIDLQDPENPDPTLELSDENSRLRHELDELRQQLKQIQPADLPPAEDAVEPEMPKVLGMPFGERRRTAIIIDDSRLIHIRYKSIIEGHGIQVVATSQDGRFGADLVLTHSPRLVILDYNMPGVNGRECTNLIRTIDNQVKIIIVSAQLDVEKIAQLKSAGANDFLIKPINEQKLREAIQRLGV